MAIPGRQSAAAAESRAAVGRDALLAPPPPKVSRRVLLRVASVACGVQFGWALQLSLLTPYVQELGIPHQFASLVWLCGPLSGLLVQPFVGHMSDRCASSLGRRRPFIIGGALSIAFSVLLIGYSADIGRILGDRGGGETRYGAISVYLVGFWLLDVGNNTTQGPCRALLADLTGKDHRRTRVANAYFSLFMALGNILGFATGSFSHWYSIFPFNVTSACSINCANLKSAFLLDVVLLLMTTCISVSSAKEIPLSSANKVMTSVEDSTAQSDNGHEAFLWELFGSCRYLTLPVWMVLIATALTWLGWFPFTLFDTDWMGREIYKGDPDEGQMYQTGVRMGAIGLMLNSIVLGFTSVVLEKLCRKFGAGLIWGISNIIMFFCFLAMLIISSLAKNIDYPPNGLPPSGLVIAALVIFTILGAPLSVTYTIPYAMISARIEPLGLGQGLSMGILNLAIVVPQMVVSVGSGPLDQLFGGSNSPAFAVGAIAAFASGLVAIVGLPPQSITIRATTAVRRGQRILNT
ncbi:sucrose transport protein SUT2-like [Zingiber officinale]|uniref:sucrose transport protein SUT2-like n=1 Tax=Zingiber officinale TaxID=94328 RepID=UPI001C4B808D|nr:sucrose transport protein SUT2-like [Zingiber officinale]